MAADNWFHTLLDKSILFSFDRTGFLRHQKQFVKIPYRHGAEVHAIVTGVSSGLGLACTRNLADLGVNLTLLVRNLEKGQKALESIPSLKNPDLRKLDMGALHDIYRFTLDPTLKPVNLLIHNAGAMPAEKRITPDGYEEIFASQVIGPYILTRGMQENGKLTDDARVIFVASGGMYLQAFDLNDLNFEKKKYNQYQAYANAKRAQVMLTKLLAQHYDSEYVFSAMHPGWVDTPGVQSYMPIFYKLMKNRLRTLDEGIDTIIWLAMTLEAYPSGKFWFDREEAPEYLFEYTKPSQEEYQKLWKYLDGIYQKIKAEHKSC